MCVFTFFGIRPSFDIKPVIIYQKVFNISHIFQEVYKRYSDTKVSLQSRIVEDIGNVMVAFKGRTKLLMAHERMEREQIELEKAVGFSAVLKKIIASVYYFYII